MPDEAQNAPPPPPPPDDKATPPNSKPKTATVDAAAGTSTADSKGTDGLGDQVHPDTQTNEADGHRTLSNPVRDPGPYVPEGGINVAHPDRSKGQHRYGDANEPVSVLMRTSTGHDLGFARPDGATHNEVQLAPDLFVSGAASDQYHKTDGKETSLTAAAQELAARPKEPAPLHE